LTLFFPIFGDGTNWASIVLSSIIIWVVTFLCLRGIKSAALMNLITTIVKIIPIIIFIAIVAYAFKSDIFIFNFNQATKLGSITSQVRNMMLVTVWVFIGIEGANIFSTRAQNRHDIGRTTIISFLLIFSILFAISLLPFGILEQSEIAISKQPSIGSLLAHIVGIWGNAFMNVGLITAVLGAFLSWVLIAAEVPFMAGKRDNLFPKIFTLENKVHFPAGSLIITAVCEQIYLILVHFYHIGYLAAIFLAAAMILPPYLFTAIYALLLVISGKTYESATSQEKYRNCIVSIIAIVYGIWLLYAARKYLLLCSIIIHSVG
jgi:arginine:ornithine antiporter/lysine permease